MGFCRQQLSFSKDYSGYELKQPKAQILEPYTSTGSNTLSPKPETLNLKVHEEIRHVSIYFEETSWAFVHGAGCEALGIRQRGLNISS